MQDKCGFLIGHVTTTPVPGRRGKLVR
jgi:hypothetical protein